MRVAPLATAPDPARLAIASSHILSCQAHLFANQPTGPGDVTGRPLQLTAGTFTDDVARGYARAYALTVVDPVEDIPPGSWVRVTIGLSADPVLFTMPALMVTSVLQGATGTVVTGVDVGACLDELVFERDTTLTGNLRTLAATMATGVPTVTRPVDVSQVPAIPIPANTVAEFGHGRWEVLLGVADLLGVDLLWTDDGDLLGLLRTNPAPAPAARLDTILVDGGTTERNRPVVRAVMLVARDATLPELVGVATASGSGVTIADRHDGDASTTQATANALAAGLLARRRTERTVREVSVAPVPWLESGTDTVDLDGRLWYVRAMTLQLPSLATALTLRDAS